MKVSISWLKELVNLKVSIEELIRLLPLRTIGTKEITDDFIELDMKGYNRADLLSMRGVAKEVAAITNSDVSFEDIKNYVWDNQNLEEVFIRGGVDSKAPVYCIAKIEELKVEKSNPQWVKKLSDAGIRTVNSLADITNLIMLEYGQPLHAFDAEKVDGIGVDTAIPDTHFVTLDGKTRKLKDNDIVIMGSNKVIGIAGIMGGKESEVTDTTTSIILEAAIFDPVQIRKTATRLGLQSEASKRFQHGLTTKTLLQALDAAIKMYQSLGGKLTAISFIDQRDLPNHPSNNRTLEEMKKTILIEDPKPVIKLTQEKINSLIGVKIPPGQVEEFLKRVCANVSHLEGGLAWHVLPPYWRLDINIEEDLIEEVARMYGYENITPKPLPNFKSTKLQDPIYNLKKTLADIGLTEVQTYSFYSTQVIRNLELETKNLIKISNPISSETEFMKDNLWPNLLEVTAKNIKNGFKDIAIFEIGKVYSPPQKETYRLSIALINGTDNPIQELNQIFQKLLKNSKISLGAGVIHPPGVRHPTRFTDNMAEVHPRIVNKFGIGERVAILEVDILVIDDHDYP